MCAKKEMKKVKSNTEFDAQKGGRIEFLHISVSVYF